MYQLLMFVAALGMSLNPANAKDKVSYGVDDRLDLYQTSNPRYLDYAKATAAQIDAKYLLKSVKNEAVFDVAKVTLEKRLEVCPEERFAKQLSVARCTGFLVAPHLLVTAAHCIDDQGCGDNMWVFDFVEKAQGIQAKADMTINKSQVYGCKKVLERKHTTDYLEALDYQWDIALIELDRPVLDRTPLKTRTTGELKTGESLVVVGHPSGLPMKIADGAVVRESSNPAYFVTNLDTFGGNSGSPVINAQTGEVEGVLVRGASDYKNLDFENPFSVNDDSDFYKFLPRAWENAFTRDYGRQCLIVNYCLEQDKKEYMCNGEEVSRISQIDLASYLK